MGLAPARRVQRAVSAPSVSLSWRAAAGRSLFERDQQGVHAD